MAGFIISVLGGKGGVGKSMVAANLAYAYATESRQKVLLVDFDQKASGDQNIITGIKGKKTVKDLADFNGALDPRNIQQYVTITPQNLAYLGMTNDSVAADSIDAEALGKHIKAFTSIFPVTVLDLGSELTPLATKALEHSTLILLVVTPDILAINQTKKVFSDLVTMMFPKEMIQFILNQYQKGHPITAETVGKQLGKAVFSTIPKDEQACIQSLTRSQAIMVGAQKNSNFAKGMTETVRKLIQKNVLKSLAKLNKPVEIGVSGDKKSNSTEVSKSWIELKSRIHKGLVEEVGIEDDKNDDPKSQIILREKTRKVIVDLLNKEDTKSIIKNREEMGQIVQEILDEALGLGPLEKLLADKNISEIMVNGFDKIYYEQGGQLNLSKVTFTNNKQVYTVISRIVHPIGRRIDEKVPFVDARLQDGSRVHAIIPPCALNGPTITIRKFPENRLTYKDLVNYGSLTRPMADFLRIAVEGFRNIVVSGGTGSGKTTLINILGGFIPADERIITCEDSAELDLPQEHVVRLETRPPNLEGNGEIDIRLLVKQTLRMRPDRIIVGECRGGETLDMLQAMGTGHDGSLTTIHSNNPRECIGRIETLVQYAGAGLSPNAIRKMIASAIHLIVQQKRLDDGSRKVTYITEVAGIQGEVVTLQDIFEFKQLSFDRNPKTGKPEVRGKFQATGFIPKFVEILEKKGRKVPKGLFTTSE